MMRLQGTKLIFSISRGLSSLLGRFCFSKGRAALGGGSSLSKGQAAIEFVLIVAVVISMIVGVLLPLFSESELSTAIAACRVGILQEAAKNGSLFLSSVDYSFSGTNVTLSPSIYHGSNKVAVTDAMKLSALKKIASTFSPSRQPANASSCVPALYYTYCVS